MKRQQELEQDPAHHLLDSMESFPMKTKGLLKQDFVFYRPLVWEGREVGQVGQRLLNVMLMPEEHPKSLENDIGKSLEHTNKALKWG